MITQQKLAAILTANSIAVYEVIPATGLTDACIVLNNTYHISLTKTSYLVGKKMASPVTEFTEYTTVKSLLRYLKSIQL